MSYLNLIRNIGLTRALTVSHQPLGSPLRKALSYLVTAKGNAAAAEPWDVVSIDLLDGNDLPDFVPRNVKHALLGCMIYWLSANSVKSEVYIKTYRKLLKALSKALDSWGQSSHEIDVMFDALSADAFYSETRSPERLVAGFNYYVEALRSMSTGRESLTLLIAKLTNIMSIDNNFGDTYKVAVAATVTGENSTTEELLLIQKQLTEEKGTSAITLFAMKQLESALYDKLADKTLEAGSTGITLLEAVERYRNVILVTKNFDLYARSSLRRMARKGIVIKDCVLPELSLSVVLWKFFGADTENESYKVARSLCLRANEGITAYGMILNIAKRTLTFTANEVNAHMISAGKSMREAIGKDFAKKFAAAIARDVNYTDFEKREVLSSVRDHAKKPRVSYKEFLESYASSTSNVQTVISLDKAVAMLIKEAPELTSYGNFHNKVVALADRRNVAIEATMPKTCLSVMLWYSKGGDTADKAWLASRAQVLDLNKGQFAYETLNKTFRKSKKPELKSKAYYLHKVVQELKGIAPTTIDFHAFCATVYGLYDKLNYNLECIYPKRCVAALLWAATGKDLKNLVWVETVEQCISVNTDAGVLEYLRSPVQPEPKKEGPLTEKIVKLVYGKDLAQCSHSELTDLACKLHYKRIELSRIKNPAQQTKDHLQQIEEASKLIKAENESR